MGFNYTELTKTSYEDGLASTFSDYDYIDFNESELFNEIRTVGSTVSVNLPRASFNCTTEAAQSLSGVYKGVEYKVHYIQGKAIKNGVIDGKFDFVFNEFAKKSILQFYHDTCYIASPIIDKTIHKQIQPPDEDINELTYQGASTEAGFNVGEFADTKAKTFISNHPEYLDKMESLYNNLNGYIGVDSSDFMLSRATTVEVEKTGERSLTYDIIDMGYVFDAPFILTFPSPAHALLRFLQVIIGVHTIFDRCDAGIFPKKIAFTTNAFPNTDPCDVLPAMHRYWDNGMKTYKLDLGTYLTGVKFITYIEYGCSDGFDGTPSKWASVATHRDPVIPGPRTRDFSITLQTHEIGHNFLADHYRHPGYPCGGPCIATNQSFSDNCPKTGKAFHTIMESSILYNNFTDCDQIKTAGVLPAFSKEGTFYGCKCQNNDGTIRTTKILISQFSDLR